MIFQEKGIDILWKGSYIVFVFLSNIETALLNIFYEIIAHSE